MKTTSIDDRIDQIRESLKRIEYLLCQNRDELKFRWVIDKANNANEAGFTELSAYILKVGNERTFTWHSIDNVGVDLTRAFSWVDSMEGADFWLRVSTDDFYYPAEKLKILI
ncbi:MAG: hypothetical protein GC193_13205 [Cryomorphaceae bacterium]|nr:hypothetical protein [Cryomorphaceae bacterium]